MKLKTMATVLGITIAPAGVTAFPASAADTPQPPAPIQPASKQHLTKVGLLTCNTSRSIGYVIGSSTDLTCTFENARGGELFEHYDGTITRVGPDIGFTKRGRLLWAVYAPSYQVPQGRLDGTYVGVSAAASVGLGVGANVLVGNLRNNINLVPISVSGSVGLSAAAGIGALTLNSSAAAR